MSTAARPSGLVGLTGPCAQRRVRSSAAFALCSGRRPAGLVQACAGWPVHTKACLAHRYMKQETFCDEFINLDLRWPENCKKAVEGCDWCFNLAVRVHSLPLLPLLRSCPVR